MDTLIQRTALIWYVAGFLQVCLFMAGFLMWGQHQGVASAVHYGTWGLAVVVPVVFAWVLTKQLRRQAA